MDTVDINKPVHRLEVFTGAGRRRVQNERLRQIIKDLQRHQFGRRAETLPEDQILLGLEDVEQAAASDAAVADEATPAAQRARAKKRRANRGSLPAHLPQKTSGAATPTSVACSGSRKADL